YRWDIANLFFFPSPVYETAWIFTMSQSEQAESASASSTSEFRQFGQRELSGVSARALSRPVFMPDTFTGVNREWSDWVEQFEMAAVVNGWDEEVKLKFMSLLLSGKAREVYTGLPPQTRLSLCVGKLPRAGTVGRVPALKQEGPEVEIPPMVSLCGQGLYIGAQVGGIEAYLLVDTGAQVSVVPRSFWESATGGRQGLVPYVGAVAVANGAELKILGKWCTVCQFESLALGVEFLVTDGDMRDLLLGNDFLTQYGAVIDVKGQCCQVMGKMVPLVSSFPGSNCRSHPFGKHRLNMTT
uniref:Peptidase A2 domain-containing protein n=1 Tax=Paramormyrops kingsleyae TaxID=1676925 RepID=A0A3B3SS97_9TELE